MELAERIGVNLFIQVIIEMWNGIFLLIMIFSLIISIRDNRKNKHIDIVIPFTTDILVFYITLYIYNLCNIMGIVYEFKTDRISYWIVHIAVFVYYVAGAFQTLFFLQLVNRYIAKQYKLKRLEILTNILQLMHIVPLAFLIATPFNGALYYFTEKNEYIRGDYFYVWHILSIGTVIFIFGVFLMYRKKIDSMLKQIMVILTVVPVIGFILNTSYSYISFNNICVSVAALLIFLMYEKYKNDMIIKNAEELLTVQKELAKNKYDLEKTKNEALIAQIQPHFINNSLMAIRSRCRNYPEIYESITNFSRYLRSHFEAIGDTEMITFEEEMENIEAYLYLEHENYGEKLKVEYDIELDDFLIPSLSVQPLVENAVRHGVATYEMGGIVNINVKRFEDKIYIDIIDRGFGKNNPTPQQIRRKAVGIENVRARLRLMAGGNLAIIGNENGTTARITLLYNSEH